MGRPVDGWTTAGVLVETWEAGTTIAQLMPGSGSAAVSSTPASRAAGKLLARSFLQMLFANNFAHGDLHPGNILVRPANHGSSSSINSSNGSNGGGSGMSGGAGGAGGGGGDGGAGFDANETNIELVFLDAGIVTELKSHDFENFTAVFGAIVRCDGP